MSRCELGVYHARDTIRVDGVNCELRLRVSCWLYRHRYHVTKMSTFLVCLPSYNIAQMPFRCISNTLPWSSSIYEVGQSVHNAVFYWCASSCEKTKRLNTRSDAFMPPPDACYDDRASAFRVVWNGFWMTGLLNPKSSGKKKNNKPFFFARFSLGT